MTASPEYLSLEDDALLKQCSVDHYRASGPGGQKRNKTSSAIRLRHHPTGLSVTASDERYQSVNKVRAINRLREAIALHVRRTGEWTPSERLQSFIAPSQGIRISERNEGYFHVVQEILDAVAACGMRISDTAEKMGLSTAHLVKFIQSNPKIWERTNQMRTQAGLKPLR